MQERRSKRKHLGTLDLCFLSLKEHLVLKKCASGTRLEATPSFRQIRRSEVNTSSKRLPSWRQKKMKLWTARRVQRRRREKTNVAIFWSTRGKTQKNTVAKL